MINQPRPSQGGGVFLLKPSSAHQHTLHLTEKNSQALKDQAEALKSA
jgi:hypothetical protein